MEHFERKALEEGFSSIAGVDEAGRGALCGPVVAAAVIFPPGYRNPDIKDSKMLRPQVREALHDRIHQDALAVGIGVVEAQVIDRINILQATLVAMKDAVFGLSQKPDCLLVDGRNAIPLDFYQKVIVGGDRLSVSIAAASIVAKVSRDKIMEIYHYQFPQYNFLRNKGYGTEEHRHAIQVYGASKIHRKSFHLKAKAFPSPSEPLPFS
ncbi:MAG: ribonuclease HII [Syntrophales bacterium]|jgi:ribonuclease HII